MVPVGVLSLVIRVCEKCARRSGAMVGLITAEPVLPTYAEPGALDE
jgi:hypothetical protein